MMTHTEGISRRRRRPGRWFIPPVVVLLFFSVLPGGPANRPVLAIAAVVGCLLVWLALTVLRRPLARLWSRRPGHEFLDTIRTVRGLAWLVVLAATIAVAAVLPITSPANGYAALTLVAIACGLAAAKIGIDRPIDSWRSWSTSLAGRVVGGIAITAVSVLAAIAAGDIASLAPWPHARNHRSASRTLAHFFHGTPPTPLGERQALRNAKKTLEQMDERYFVLSEGDRPGRWSFVPFAYDYDRNDMIAAMPLATEAGEPITAYRLAVALGDAQSAALYEAPAAEHAATAQTDERFAFERARADSHMQRRDHAAAITGYRAALQLVPDHPPTLADLAMAHIARWDSRGQDASAERTYSDVLLPTAFETLQRAAAACEAGPFAKPAHDAAHSNLMSNMGWVCSARGEPERAHGFYDRALALNRVRLGELGASSPYLASSIESLGHVHLDLGRFAAAAENFAESTAIRRAHFGRRHPTIAVSLRLLGEALEGDGRIEEAIAAHRESARVARDLAGDWREWSPVGNPDELTEHERAWFERQVEDDAFDELAPSLTALMTCLVRQQRFEEALEPAREALDFCRWFLPEGDPIIETWEGNVGMVELGVEMGAGGG